MLSKLENGIDWDTSPTPSGGEANVKAIRGTETMNSDDRHFYALYFWEHPHRKHVPDEIRYESGLEMFTFVDKANPFLPFTYNMLAVPEPQKYDVQDFVRDLGYKCTIRDDVSHFTFNPRPTVGEIIIGPKTDA
jgi:hypothetical protein